MSPKKGTRVPEAPAYQPNRWARLRTQASLAMAGVLLAALSALVSILVAQPTRAESAEVPAEVQAELLTKIVVHDRNQAARAGAIARVMLLVKSSSTRSALSAAAMKLALSRIERIGGLPHEEIVAQYENAPALAKRCRNEHISILYVTPGLGDDVDQLRSSLSGVDLLSVSAVPEYVPKGIVLGFDLVSGRPKLVVNLAQAKEQNVNFKGDVLALMRVYR